MCIVRVPDIYNMAARPSPAKSLPLSRWRKYADTEKVKIKCCNNVMMFNSQIYFVFVFVYNGCLVFNIRVEQIHGAEAVH